MTFRVLLSLRLKFLAGLCAVSTEEFFCFLVVSKHRLVKCRPAAPNPCINIHTIGDEKLSCFCIASFYCPVQRCPIKIIIISIDIRTIGYEQRYCFYTTPYC